MKKKVLMFGVLVLLVLSSFVSAGNESSCRGFWGTVTCVLWGNPQVRSSLAGEAYSRNLVGDGIKYNGKSYFIRYKYLWCDGEFKTDGYCGE